MPRTIVVTNKLSTANVLVVDGTRVPISPSGSIAVDEGALLRCTQDPAQWTRFLPTGDLTHGAFAPAEAGIDLPKFSAVLDLTALQSVTLVPPQSGRSWVMTKLKISVLAAGGGITAGTLNVTTNGTLAEGWAIDASFPTPTFSLFGLVAPVNTPVVLQVATAATGGPCSVQVDAFGAFA